MANCRYRRNEAKRRLSECGCLLRMGLHELLDLLIRSGEYLLGGYLM